MDTTSFEIAIGKALESTGFEVVAESCGFSLYDRRQEAGKQLLANTGTLEELVGILLEHHCVFARK